jgi:uncharacterized Rmd1/YagE family protein
MASQVVTAPCTGISCTVVIMMSSNATAASKAVLLPREGEAGFQAQALLVGTRIDLKQLGATDRTLGTPLVVELIGSLTGNGIAVLYGYGAVVFFDASPAAITEYLRQIAGQIGQPFAQHERDVETLEIRVDPEGREKLEGNALVVTDVTVGKLQMIADILAKSVALAHHERAIERQFERIEPFAANLDHWSRAGRTAHELLQHLGAALLAEHRVVGGARIDDAPELLWDHPELERLWARLRDEFEIRERFGALHGKLALISRTAETALELLQHRSSLRVEWAIVGLIVFEIVLTLVQWGFGVGH